MVSAYILIQTEVGKAGHVTEMVRGIEGIVSVDPVTGPYDIVARAEAQDLDLLAKGTVMPMVGRRGEWIQVQLSPEMRKTGMVMRWYGNESSGWVHDSMVEFLTPEPKP